jgi:hypothetical protein
VTAIIRGVCLAEINSCFERADKAQDQPTDWSWPGPRHLSSNIAHRDCAVDTAPTWRIS